MASNLVGELYDLVDTTLNSFVINGSQDVITSITPIFSSLLLLWVVIWGYMVMYGQTDQTLKTGIFKIVQVGLISTLALTSANYNDIVINFLLNAPEQIAGIVIGTPGYSTGSALDTLFQKVFDTADSVWEKGGLMNGNFGMYLLAILIAGIGTVLTAITAGLILLSKMLLAVLLVLGPIAIMLLLFKPTERFFESWLGQCINLGLIYILAVTVASIVIDLSDTFISNTPDPDLKITMAVFLVFLLSIIIIRQVEPLASALGGGIALATQGAISNGMSKLRPSRIKRQINSTRSDFRTAGRAASAPARGAANLARKGQHAYQRKFGRGNSISG